jgi:hypothetical protein
MMPVRLPPFPVVGDELRSGAAKALKLEFSSPGGPPPGAALIAANRYVFGRGSDWNSKAHALQIDCVLIDSSVLAALFGPEGVVCKNAGILIVLEWASVKSSRRGFCSSRLMTRREVASGEAVKFEVCFSQGELLGEVHLTLEVFVGASGRPTAEERHLANEPGLRLGSLSETWELILDGQGSLFPITQAKHAPTDPLWSMKREKWEDVTYDEFSQEFVALEVNEGHPAFGELYGSASAPYATQLFRQVLVCWLLLFFEALEARTREEEIDPDSGDRVTQWEAIVDPNGRYDRHLLPGSIGKAARVFVSRGDLDVSSPEALVRTAQVWIDQRFSRG